MKNLLFSLVLLLSSISSLFSQILLNVEGEAIIKENLIVGASPTETGSAYSILTDEYLTYGIRDLADAPASFLSRTSISFGGGFSPYLWQSILDIQGLKLAALGGQGNVLVSDQPSGMGGNNIFGSPGLIVEGSLTNSQLGSGYYAGPNTNIMWTPANTTGGNIGKLLSLWDADLGTERWFVDANGNIGSSSDQKWKKDIRIIDKPIKKIKKIKGVSYRWRTSKTNAKENTKPPKSFGVIAQELEAIIPEAVSTNEKGDKFVYYDALIPLLIEVAKKEIQSREKIEEELELLKEEKESLKRRLEAIESFIAKEKGTQTSIVHSAKLGQNVPNPFNYNTKIPYFIPRNSQLAKIKIHTITGQLVKTIIITTYGEGNLELQTENLHDGQYTYTLEIDETVIDTKQMLSLKRK